MGFLYGVIGAATALLLFAAGFAVGMLFHSSLHKVPRPGEGMSEEAKRVLEEQQAVDRAFQTLQSYSPDIAYGIRQPDMYEGGGRS